MANNFYDKELRRHLQESEPYRMDSLFQDPKFQFPEEVIGELNARIPNPYGDAPQAATPEIPKPNIDASAIPAPTFEAPPIGPSSFDVNKSAGTVTMDGREDSLPSLAGISGPSIEDPKKLWELEEDETKPTTDVVSAVKDPSATIDPRAEEDTTMLATSEANDQERRDAELSALEKRRKLQIIPELGAGIGDAISASSSAFGGNAPGGSRERMIARHDTQLTEGKADVETKLRNDAGSDVSKQYQNLLAQMMQKELGDPALIGMTANQIAEKIPMIEKMMQRRSNEDLKKLALDAANAKDGGLSPAQTKFDQEMAKLTAEFTDGGGIKVAKQAVNQLENSIARFKKLDPGFLSRVGAVMSPDGVRGLIQPEYKAIEQEVRQNVTELLRATLGAQFTEKEGERIFSQTFDPTLPMKTNLARTIALQTKLNAIADERARAVQYFTQHGTFNGYQPQSDMTWTYGDQADTPKDAKPKTTKSGYKYSVGP